MKIISTFLLLFTFLFSNAQGEKELKLPAFHTVKAFDLINVQLIKSDKNSLDIRGKNSGEVTYVVNDGVLKIRMELEELFDGDKTYVTVYYTNLEVIDANEGVDMYIKDISGQDAIEIRSQEGAHVTAGVDVNTINVRAVTGGTVTVFGTTVTQDVVVNTGGIVSNKELKSESTNVKVQAGGEVEVYASNAVDALVRAGGEITVFGNPSLVNQKTVLGGQIRVQ